MLHDGLERLGHEILCVSLVSPPFVGTQQYHSDRNIARLSFGKIIEKCYKFVVLVVQG